MGVKHGKKFQFHKVRLKEQSLDGGKTWKEVSIP